MFATPQEEWPDISEYSWQKRRSYLIAVALVSSADGALDRNEINLLERWMVEFRLSQLSRNQVWRAAKHHDADLSDLVHKFVDTDLTYSLVLDMMGMAMTDGILADEEVLLLGGASRLLGISDTAFHIMVEFVHSVWQQFHLSNPEPLFDYNIEKTFELFITNKAKLFRHTLFCTVSEIYDSALKKRWLEYKKEHGF